MTHPSLEILRTPEELRTWQLAQAQHNASIALVPTMGALHAGHRALIDHVRPKADKVLVSIFVNPSQFAPGEDLDRYPKPLEADLAALKACQADAVFLPSPTAIYPQGFQTHIEPGSLASRLCGASRPGHFAGVCTVVLLLFQMSRCHMAVFGEKDFQQLAIIRQMSRDLHLPVHIHAIPIVREPDGLAQSSRNNYLSPSQRQQAPGIARALQHTAEHISSLKLTSGKQACDFLLAKLQEYTCLPQHPPLDHHAIEYAELVDARTLQPIQETIPKAQAMRLMVALKLGTTRLIDNWPCFIAS